MSLPKTFSNDLDKFVPSLFSEKDWPHLDFDWSTMYYICSRYVDGTYTIKDMIRECSEYTPIKENLSIIQLIGWLNKFKSKQI